MTKRNGSNDQDCGRRLACLRMEASYAQPDLAQELDISRRKTVIYEGETKRPSAKLLPNLAAPPGLLTDALLGIEPRSMKQAAKPDWRLERRMPQIERMPAREMCQVPQLTDGFIEREQLQSAKG